MMYTDSGLQKGLRSILEERGIETAGMRKADIASLLKTHDDFKNQRPWLEEICSSAGHLILFFPKFHPELNWIERYWSDAKRYCRKNCDYTFETLRTVVPQGLEQVDLSSMRKYARKLV